MAVRAIYQPSINWNWENETVEVCIYGDQNQEILIAVSREAIEDSGKKIQSESFEQFASRNVDKIMDIVRKYDEQFTQESYLIYCFFSDSVRVCSRGKNNEEIDPRRIIWPT